MLHGVIVERDHDSRDLLLRVLGALDWNTDVFNALSDAEDHLSGAWGLFVGAELVDRPAAQAMQRLRHAAPDIAIVLISPSLDLEPRRTLDNGGADVVLTRPLTDAAVIDAVGKALINRPS